MSYFVIKTLYITLSIVYEFETLQHYNLRPSIGAVSGFE